MTSVFALGAVRFSVTLVSSLSQRMNKIKLHCDNNVMMSKGSFYLLPQSTPCPQELMAVSTAYFGSGNHYPIINACRGNFLELKGVFLIG